MKIVSSLPGSAKGELLMISKGFYGQMSVLLSYSLPLIAKMIARNPEVVPPCYKVKFPPKVHVWGMMSHQALSDLHIVPKGQTITGTYYRDFILANTCKDALKRRAKKGSILKLAMSRNMSEIIFQQDGAPHIRLN